MPKDKKKGEKAKITHVKVKGVEKNVNKNLHNRSGEGAFYYSPDGTFLGRGTIGKTDEVRLAKLTKTASGNDEFDSVDIAGKTANHWVVVHKDHKTFLKYCSCIDQESDGAKEESFAIASAMVNYTNSKYASDNSDTLDAMVSKKNNEWYGVDKNVYDKYIKRWDDEHGNVKFAIGRALNALLGGTDYSKGGMLWDGGDLVHKDYINSDYDKTTSHRRTGIIDSTEKDSIIAAFNDHFKPKFGKNFIELVEKAAPDGNYGIEATVCIGGPIFFKPYSSSKKPESQVLAFRWETTKF